MSEDKDNNNLNNRSVNETKTELFWNDRSLKKHVLKEKKKNEKDSVEAIKKEEKTMKQINDIPKSEEKLERKIEPKKIKKKRYILTNILLISAMIMTVAAFGYIVFSNMNDLKSNMTTIVSSFIISLFIITFILFSINSKNKSSRFLVISSLLIIAFSFINIVSNSYAFPQNTVIDMTNMSINEAIKWADSNNIILEQSYDNSDSIKKYNIISQNVKEGTSLEKTTNIQIIVSEGPNYNKEVIFPSVIGWTYDEVMDAIDSSLLNNVEINFVISNEEKDRVIDQSISGQIHRNDKLVLTFSIGTEKDIVPINIINLTNMSEFKATSYLKRYGIKFELKYDYSSTIDKGNVIKASAIEGQNIDPATDTVILTISKGKEIIVPDILNMSTTEITSWIVKNDLKVVFTDQYDENTKLGYVIKSSVKKGDIISAGDTVSLTISKGQLKMQNFNSLNDFKTWANKYNIEYNEERQFNETLTNGSIIKFSHNVGQIIKNDDTITVYVSQGKAVKLPNFVGMSKSNITKKCSELKITCSFSYGSYSDSIAKDIATKQSKTANSEVVEKSNVLIVLSKGKVQKVTVPNFVGMSKSNIINKCKSLGLNYKFVSGSYSSSYAKDVATKQSVSSSKVVAQGTTITFTLSLGAAKTYVGAVIQSNWLVSGNSSSSITSVKNSLSRLYPGITFAYKTVVNDGLPSGLISPTSAYKADTKYTFVQGNTYTITFIK